MSSRWSRGGGGGGRFGGKGFDLGIWSLCIMDYCVRARCSSFGCCWWLISVSCCVLSVANISTVWR